jgi:hypothetical protein
MPLLDLIVKLGEGKYEDIAASHKDISFSSLFHDIQWIYLVYKSYAHQCLGRLGRGGAHH